jgi:aminoglycoside 6'-N-acetyltransferase
VPFAELRGERVLLRAVQGDDLPQLVALFREPAVAEWWIDFGEDRIRREIVDDSDDPGSTIYVIEVDGALAGIVQCHEEQDPEYRSAAIDIAVSSVWHGRGIAVDALRTLARDLIEVRGHHHLTIDPAAANARAIACYSKVGFRPVGILRQHELGADGTFHDALLMDMLAGELT